jgi:hypothetical protein
MIRLEIISSPDLLMIGTLTYFRNLCLISKDQGDILINDPGLCDGHLVLELQKTGLYAYKHSSVESFKINGKLAITHTPLNPLDIIEIASTSIRILEYKHLQFPNKKDLIQTQVQKISQEKNFEDLRELLMLIQEDSE